MSALIHRPDGSQQAYAANCPASDILDAEGGAALQTRGGGASAPGIRYGRSAVVPPGQYDLILPPVVTAVTPAAGQCASICLE